MPSESDTPGPAEDGQVERDVRGPPADRPARGPENADDTAPPGLTFSELPRLELDQLLGQLVERAQEVLATQGRLRGLLRANQLIIADLALPAVLPRIVDAARELIGARYAALGVISPTGGLAEFVHAGMPDGAMEQIGRLPQGKGLLGALIDDPRPIRLQNMADDPRSSGLPPGHPPMRSFLGVPIRIRDEIFGNLYLAESTGGGFSAEDEELATALAATAAVAIDNARHFESARTRGEWLQASAAITRQLLSPDADDATLPLRMIAERSLELADADLVTVSLPSGDAGDALRIEVAVGTGAEGIPGRTMQIGCSLAGHVFTTRQPMLLADPHDVDPNSVGRPLLSHVGPMLLVPLVGSRGVQGVLTAARLRGRTTFTADDVDMAGSFANHAAIAIELAEARAEQQRAAMLDERDRIAADLHDHVIQRLFAAGLSLQSVAMGLRGDPAADRLLATVQDLDATISQIRTTIFQLQDLPAPDPDGVRGRVLDVAAEAARVLGFEPAVRFTGAVDDPNCGITDDVVAVLREALANVVRHAQAHSVEIELVACVDQLDLSVQDDGVGMPERARYSGLANMRQRAERRGGALAISRVDPKGTRLTWSVPNN